MGYDGPYQVVHSWATRMWAMLKLLGTVPGEEGGCPSSHLYQLMFLLLPSCPPGVGPTGGDQTHCLLSL